MNLFRRLWAKLQGDSVPDMARLRGGRVAAPARNPHWTQRRKLSPAEEAEALAVLRKLHVEATPISHVTEHTCGECVQPTAATHPDHLICPFCGERVGQTDFHWHDDRASGAMEPRRIWHCTAGHIWTIVGGIRTEVPVSKEPESFREDWDRPDMAVYDKM